MIVGRRSPLGSVSELLTDTKRVARFVAGDAGRVSKLSAYLDGLGSGEVTRTATASGNEITDLLRGSGVEGDGLGYQWVTNLFGWGSAESGSLGFGAYGGSTVAASTNWASEGTHSVRVDVPAGTFAGGRGTSGGSAVWLDVREQQDYTTQLVVFFPTAGINFQVGLEWFDSSGLYINGDYRNFISTGAVQVISFTTTIPANRGITKAAPMAVRVTDGTATTFYFDAVQVEVGSVAHNYVATNNGVSASALQAGPRSSFGLYEGTTNLIRNGSARADLTNWSASGYLPTSLMPGGVSGTQSTFETAITGWIANEAHSTVTRDTTRARFGTASMKVVTDASGIANTSGANFSNGAAGVVLTAAATYVLGMWVYTSETGLQVQAQLTDNIDQGVGGSVVTLTANTWTFVSASGTLDAHTTRFPRINIVTAGAHTFWVDSVVLEAGATPSTVTDPLLTRFTGDGPFGTGLEFSYTNKSGYGVFFWNNLSPYFGAFDTTKRYTVSFWARGPSTNTAWLVHIGDSTSTNLVMPQKNFTTASNGTWTRYVFSFDPLHAGGTPVLFFGGAAANGAVLRIAGVQIEQRSTATAYKDTPSGASAARSAIDLEFPAQNIVNPYQGWAAFYTKPSWASGQVATLPVTVAGNEITDRTRFTKTEGDGLGTDSSYGIYPTRTNLILNGGAETNLSNIGAAGLNSPAAWATAPVAGAGTGLTGTFVYRVTVVAVSVNGTFESNTNGQSASVTVANKDVSVTLPVAQNGDATGRSIYRSSDGGTTWKFVATVNTTPLVAIVYTDNVPDASLTTVAAPNPSPPANGQALVTRTTARSAFGAACFSAVTPGAVTSEGLFASTASGLARATGSVATGSVWAMSTAGPSVRVWVRINNTDGSITDGAAATVTLTGTFQRIITPTATVAAGKTATSYQVMLRTNAIVASTIFADGFQVEETSYATPYIHTDGAAVTKSGGQAQIPAASGTRPMGQTTGWVFIRVRMPNTPSAMSAFASNPPRLWSWGNNPGGGDGLQVYVNTDYSGKIAFTRNGVGVVSSSAAWTTAGATIGVLVYWTSTTIGISVNGGAFTTAANTVIPSSMPANMEIGSMGGSVQIIGDVHMFASGQGTPTNTDATNWSGFSSGQLAVGLDSFGQRQSIFWGADAPNFNVYGSPSNYPSLFNWGQDNDNELLVFYDATEKAWSAGRDALTVVGGRPAINTTHNAGAPVFVMVYWTGTTLAISVNGSAFTVVSNTTVPNVTTTNFYLGRRSWTVDGFFDGEIVWAAFGANTPTNADAAALFALGEAGPTHPTDLPAKGTMTWGADTTAYQTPEPLNATAKLKPVIYDATGVKLGEGDEVLVPSGQTAGWVDLTFGKVAGGVPLPAAGNYDLGLLAGGDTRVVRVYELASTLGGQTNADTYTDGASAPLGSATALTKDMALYGFASKTWTPAPDADEFYYARLPFPEAQKKLQETGAIHTTAKVVQCSWHGTSVDPERGSFAVVKAGGVFDSWIGERVKLTSRGVVGTPSHSVYVYVHTSADMDDEISVPRRVFLAMASPGLDRIWTTVEMLG